MKPYGPAVLDIIGELCPKTLLDAPSGDGWLAKVLRSKGHPITNIYGADICDLGVGEDYAHWFQEDLNYGLPDSLPGLDMVVSCEGLEHLHSPMRFIQGCFERLNSGGFLVVTTPSVWFPSARLSYLLRGFFPSFPSLIGKIGPGSHMHISPFNFPQLYLLLTLAGFQKIRLHEVRERKPKRVWEWIFGVFPTLYCLSRARRTTDAEEKSYWLSCGSKQSIYGRRLVVSAQKPA